MYKSLLAETFNELSSDEGNIYFNQKPVDESQLVNWEEHVKTFDKEVSELQIVPNKYNFEGNNIFSYILTLICFLFYSSIFYM